MAINSSSITDLGSIGGAILPTIKIYGSGLVSTITWVIFIVFFLIIAGTIAYFVYQKKKYNNTIIIFEKINGRWIDTKKDKATEMAFGDLGMKILYCKTYKKYLPKPSKQSGTRKFYFRIRSDGNWENFEFLDDEGTDTVRFHSVEKSITERNVGIRKGLADRLKTSNWLKENAVLLVSVLAIIVVLIFMWLIMDKWIALATTTNEGVKVSGQVMDKADAILGKLDNILSQSGSGIVTKLGLVFR